MSKKIIILIIITSGFLSNAKAENVLQYYETQASKENPKHQSFDIAEGKKMFLAERIKSNGEKIGCTNCHTNDPKTNGKTRANKLIEPLAPVANSQRFSDIAQVEKWFLRNCKDVLERPCSINEKGNFTKYMNSIK